MQKAADGHDIAFLLGYPEISGGTNVIIEHALGLTRLGHRVSIVTELPFDGRRLAWKPEALSLPRLCHAECRDRLFDLAIATWWRSVYDLPFVPARRYAYFCQSIESRFFSPADADMKALVEYTYRQPLAVVTEAGWIVDYLREHYGHEAALVRNGIDKRIFRPDGPALEPRPRYGLRVLLEGALGVPFKRIELSVGLCRQAGVDDVWLLTPTPCSEFPGVQRVLSGVPMGEVGAVYRSCDVLLKLSTVEGMFGPPLEMMHCGGTAVTSDVTGHEEYMRHGENGLVVRRGEETDVIAHLRRLKSDPAWLEALKAGAARTAAGWPDWSQAVAEMDAFVRGLVARPLDAAAARDQMLRQLRAALQLAGPLRRVVSDGYSGWELLARLRKRAARKALRTLGPLGRLLNGREAPVYAPEFDFVSLPEAGGPTTLAAKSAYRVCFVGHEQKHASFVPSSSERLTALFVEAAGLRSPASLRAIRDFGPDVFVVFDPQHVPERDLEALGGIVVGCVLAPATTGLAAACRARFPLTDHPRACLLHPDAEVVAKLRRSGVNAIGSFPVPVDVQNFSCRESFESWRLREIAMIHLGPATGPVRNWVRLLGRRPDFVHVPQPPGKAALRALLTRARVALHVPDARSLLLDSAAAVRDMVCGCLVAAPRLHDAHGLMPGEDYACVCTPDELAALLDASTDAPGALEVLRRNGMQKAAEFDAGRRYVELLDKLAGHDSLVSAATASTAATLRQHTGQASEHLRGQAGA